MAAASKPESPPLRVGEIVIYRNSWEQDSPAIITRLAEPDDFGTRWAHLQVFWAPGVQQDTLDHSYGVAEAESDHEAEPRTWRLREGDE